MIWATQFSTLARLVFGFQSVLILFAVTFIPVLAESPKESQSRHNQARKIIDQSSQFQLNASKYHASVKLQNADAHRLGLEASRLNAGVRKLNASIQEKVDIATPHKLGAKEYSLHLGELQKHASLYNAHLLEYEKQVLKAQKTAGQLRSNCEQYCDHVQKYHIPGVKPPHICVQLQYDRRELQQAARGFQQDQIKSQQAEALLAGQEAQLAQAAHERAVLEKRILEKADLDELERTQGAMLLKEYQQIEREYRMLEAERKSVGRNSTGTK